MSKEIRWQNGKQEYSRDEINHMLSTQRNMIYNDIKYILINQAEKKGLKGLLTDEGIEIDEYIKNCRKVNF